VVVGPPHVGLGAGAVDHRPDPERAVGQSDLDAAQGVPARPHAATEHGQSARLLEVADPHGHLGRHPVPDRLPAAVEMGEELAAAGLVQSTPQPIGQGPQCVDHRTPVTGLGGGVPGPRQEPARRGIARRLEGRHRRATVDVGEGEQAVP